MISHHLKRPEYRQQQNDAIPIRTRQATKGDAVNVDIDPHAPLLESDKLIVIANTEKLSKLK